MYLVARLEAELANAGGFLGFAFRVCSSYFQAGHRKNAMFLVARLEAELANAGRV
jgi:hypothetical protein